MPELRDARTFSHAQIYTALWARYCAAGRPSGPGPAGAAQWAYTQALPYVSPATAEHIAAAVLAAGQAATSSDTAHTPRASSVTNRRGLLQCATCGAVAPRRSPPPGWLRVESLHREPRHTVEPHDFCSAACLGTWLGLSVPAAESPADSAAPPPAVPPVHRRAVRVIRS